MISEVGVCAIHSEVDLTVWVGSETIVHYNVVSLVDSKAILARALSFVPVIFCVTR